VGDAASGETSITLQDIYLARKSIAPWVQRTPLLRSDTLSRQSGASVFLKLETVHDVGAFKIRGATNRLLNLAHEQKQRGVVTASTGNHGRSVVSIARKLGVSATVCMSSLVPGNKVAAISDLGGDVCIVGSSQDEAEQHALDIASQQGVTYVPPFDDPHIIAGQGTIGLELLEDLGRVDTVLVGLSGGGLMSGIAIALKAANPHVRLVGVSMERGAAMFESVRHGHPVEVREEESLADSLGGGIGLHNAYTFDIIRELVDDYILVSEEQIAAGMRHLYQHERLVAEGAGAVGVAAIVAGLAGDLAGNVVSIISGNNVDMDRFRSIVAGAE